MARQNPDGDRLSNPAQLFLEWSGSKGCFIYYDKEAKANVELKLPFTFIVLDTLHTLKGYNEKEEIGYYSNEVKDMRVQTFKVKSKNGPEYTGLYNTFSEAFKNKGGKYGQSVYVAIKKDNELVIANIFMSGSALAGGATKADKKVEVGGWMDFAQKHRSELYTKAVLVKNYTDCIKGKNEYYVPNFTLVDVTPETDAIAEVLQKEVMAYVKEYLKNTQSEQSEEELAQRVEKANESVYATKDEPEMSNHEAIMGEGQQKENAPIDEDESSDLPF